jgi:small subunit ribosomal protein S17
MARQLEGKIISDKMQKTAVVAVTHSRKHSKYLKYYNVTNKFKAHNENNEYKTGDVVIIEETRPLSKDKYFKIVKLVKKAVKLEE